MAARLTGRSILTSTLLLVGACGGSTSDAPFDVVGTGGPDGSDDGGQQDDLASGPDEGVDSHVPVDDAAADAQPESSIDAPDEPSIDTIDDLADATQDIDTDGPEDASVDAPQDVGADAGFTPDDLTGLELWLASDVGVTASGGFASAWADQSGNHHDAVQASASAQPTYVALGQNGLPVLRFDGNSWMKLPPGFADFSAGLSVFVVVHPTASAQFHAPRFFDFAPSYGSLASSVLFVRYGSTNTELFFQTYQGTTPGAYVDVKNAIFDGVWQRLAVVQAGGVPGMSTVTTIYKDGAPLGSGTVAVADYVVRASNLIGKSNLAADTNLRGDVAEILLYARELTDAERSSVDGYLKTKWGL